eukprot:GHVL01040486.1.p1 GENE.GHVL01040486.1~~GHVL01040486.1.p1  ORF type:complete len:505 (-),score=207.30 GHVL01040486.1:3016-4530(-)
MFEYTSSHPFKISPNIISSLTSKPFRFQVLLSQIIKSKSALGITQKTTYIQIGEGECQWQEVLFCGKNEKIFIKTDIKTIKNNTSVSSVSKKSTTNNTGNIIKKEKIKIGELYIYLSFHDDNDIIIESPKKSIIDIKTSYYIYILIYIGYINGIISNNNRGKCIYSKIRVSKNQETRSDDIWLTKSDYKENREGGGEIVKNETVIDTTTHGGSQKEYKCSGLIGYSIISIDPVWEVVTVNNNETVNETVNHIGINNICIEIWCTNDIYNNEELLGIIPINIPILNILYKNNNIYILLDKYIDLIPMGNNSNQTNVRLALIAGLTESLTKISKGLDSRFPISNKWETVNNDTVKNETVNNETVKNETVKNETVENETVKNETVEKVSLVTNNEPIECQINKKETASSCIRRSIEDLNNKIDPQKCAIKILKFFLCENITSAIDIVGSINDTSDTIRDTILKRKCLDFGMTDQEASNWIQHLLDFEENSNIKIKTIETYFEDGKKK